ASNNEGDRVIGAEMEILTSWDLAVQVAQAIGPRRLLPTTREPTEREAASSIILGLKVISNKGSNIILISYKNPNPEMATLVLQELLSLYFVKHLEVHRSAGAFDFVAQQTDQVRARLNQNEDALKSLREKTGIASLKEGSVALTNEAAKIQDELNAAQAQLAEQQALVSQKAGDSSKGWRKKKPTDEKAKAAGAQARVETLKARLRDVQQRTKQLADLAPQIEDLERKREMDE